jgi:predicted RecB family nuclease
MLHRRADPIRPDRLISHRNVRIAVTGQSSSLAVLLSSLHHFDVIRGRLDLLGWDDYEAALVDARAILARQLVPLPGYSSVCKLCHWHTFCIAQLIAEDDLTLIPFLRRSDRDVMRDSIPTIAALATSNPEGFIKGKKTVFAGIGADRLRLLQARAAMLKASPPKPYLREPVALDLFPLELFFDVEVDPLRGICYLHGFVERRNRDNTTERYVSFLAEEPTPAAERDAFTAAFDYLAAHVDAAIYYYSKYERTIYRKLQQKYPDICTPEDVEGLFEPPRAIDLYGDVVLCRRRVVTCHCTRAEVLGGVSFGQYRFHFGQPSAGHVGEPSKWGSRIRS